MRTRAIIRVEADGESWVFDTGPGNKLLKSAKCSITKNKEARSLDFSIADPHGDLANSIPFPKKNTVDVNAWFGSETILHIFSGTLTSHSWSFFPGALMFTATDRSKTMRRARKANTWSNQTAEAIVKTIADQYGYDVDLSRANLPAIEIAQEVQNGETDWALLVRVLGQLGHDVRVRYAEEVPVGQPVPANEPVVIDVVELGAEDDASRLPVIQLGDTSGGSLDVDEYTAATTPNILANPVDPDIEATSSQPGLDPFGLVVQSVDVPEFDAQELHRVAKAQAKAKKIIEGSISLLEPRPELDATKQVVLAGFGNRYDGVWNIEKVTHDLVAPASPTSLRIWRG